MYVLLSVYYCTPMTNKSGVIVLRFIIWYAGYLSFRETRHFQMLGWNGNDLRIYGIESKSRENKETYAIRCNIKAVSA